MEQLLRMWEPGSDDITHTPMTRGAQNPKTHQGAGVAAEMRLFFPAASQWMLEGLNLPYVPAGWQETVAKRQSCSSDHHCDMFRWRSRLDNDFQSPKLKTHYSSAQLNTPFSLFSHTIGSILNSYSFNLYSNSEKNLSKDLIYNYSIK